MFSTLNQKTKTDNEPVLSPADKRERCSQVPAVKCEAAGPPQTQCRTVPRQGLNIRNQIFYKIYIFLTTNLNLRKPLPLQNEMQKMNLKTNNRPQMLSFFLFCLVVLENVRLSPCMKAAVRVGQQTRMQANPFSPRSFLDQI